MHTIILHGSLRSNRAVAEQYTIFCDTAWEAIEAVSLQLAHLKPSLSNPMRSVVVAECDTIEALKVSHIEAKIINLLPAVGFSEKSAAGRFIVGALKVVAAVFLYPIAPNLAVALSLSGIGDMLGGIAQALSPQPKRNTAEEDEKTKNRYLGAPQNTVGMGVRIPRGYGTVRVAGHFLSFNTDSVEVL